MTMPLAAAREMAVDVTDADPEAEDITDAQDLTGVITLGESTEPEPVAEPPPDPRL